MVIIVKFKSGLIPLTADMPDRVRSLLIVLNHIHEILMLSCMIPFVSIIFQQLKANISLLPKIQITVLGPVVHVNTHSY